jgi:hypothetical protein
MDIAAGVVRPCCGAPRQGLVVLTSTSHAARETVNRTLASIAEGIIDKRFIYDCPWDDFRFNYFRGQDSDTAARELIAWTQPQGIKVEFDLRRERGLDVIYVLLAAR